MAFKATKAQEAAIKADGGVLVAAAAGSGKTAVLTERVIRRLCDRENPISADRLLIVTFTNSAAAEMRRRIEARLAAECAAHPEDASLMRQRRLISSAKICTIDSFCIDLVRESFEQCGVQPDFRVSDGSDLAEIDARVMSRLVCDKLEENSPEFKRLLQITDCTHNEKNLTERIIEAYNHSMQTPFPEGYLRSLTAPYEMPFGTSHPWYTAAFGIARETVCDIRNTVDEILEDLKYVEKITPKTSDKLSIIQSISEMLAAAVESGDWDTLNATVMAADMPTRLTFPKDEIGDRIRAGLEDIKQSLGELTELFFDDTAGIEAFMADFLPCMRLFEDMTKEYSSELFKAYNEENTLTFAHTEQLAFSLLCDYRDGAVCVKPSAAELLSRFDEVMVDEFQDVNDLQSLLFETLSGGGSRLFAVGDVKQSIYGFRGSNPKNFLYKKNTYVPVCVADENDKKKIILADNFRSHKGVCDFVNFLFSLCLCGQTGELIYDDDERLCAAASFPEVSSAAELLMVAAPDSDDDGDLFRCEAEAIAEYIKNTIKEPPFVRCEEGTRTACYDDFAILLNTMTGRAEIIAAALKHCGIPVAFSAEVFNESIEIKTFLSLLRVIDNPRRDVELLTVMLSPIFALTASEVAEIRINDTHTTLYGAVLVAAAKENQNAAVLLERLAKMRRSAATLSVSALVELLLRETDYLNAVSAMSGGEGRRDNLLTLLKLARDYTSAGRTGIAGFLRMLESRPDRDSKGRSAGTGVKIMSMHASKGLQFPICIIGNLHTRINNKDYVNSVLRSEKYGMGIRYKDERADTAVKTLPHRIIANEARVNTIDERLRLLYVAMTRAEDRLVMVSANKNVAERLEKIAACIENTSPRIPAKWLKRTVSMNDWLLACALLHPDGELLRRLCGRRIEPEHTAEQPLKISFVSAPESVESSENGEEKPAADPELTAALLQSFSFEYPNAELCKFGVKASVSQLAKSQESDLYAYSEKPSFMEKGGISAAERGTAAHRVMQFIDMTSVPDIDSEIERLYEYRFITERQRDAVDRTKIAAFFKSDIYLRIAKSNDVRREMRFLTEAPLSFVSGQDDAPDASVIIQGAVDLCFVEDGEVVVLDFKTDRVADMSALAERYGKQLDIYADACERIFGLPVKQRVIYSLHLSKGIVL